MTGKITQIRKRNGSVVPFETAKIERAIGKAFAATAPGQEALATVLAEQVVGEVEKKFVGLVPVLRTCRT